jgi:hypothetical protein
MYEKKILTQIEVKNGEFMSRIQLVKRERSP